jgi:predicted Zn-dependent protease
MVVLWNTNKHSLQVKTMKKLIFQGASILLLFFIIWLALSQVDWINIFQINQVTDKTEEKLGDKIWEVIQQSEKEIRNVHVVNSVDSIINHVCKENNIAREKLNVHILENSDINAFALPNGHLIIYSGLILNADNEEELAGVICHEIAHIELNHIMKKLVKEVGLSVLISMTTGNGGAEIIKETARMLSSTAFDRSLERDADIKAVDYMVNAKINPESFANFLYKISISESGSSQYLNWINTHPDSKERSAYIIEYSKGKYSDHSPILTAEQWENVKTELEN